MVHLTTAASNPLGYISSASKTAGLHLDMAIEVDMTKTILSTATAQSRILRKYNDIVKTLLFTAIEVLVLNAVSLCPAQAAEDTRARSAVKIEKHSPEDLHREIAFVMCLVGNFVKCFASGNRRTLSNNTLREILASRSRHKR